MSPIIKHQHLRKKLWIKAFCSTANANNCISSHTAIRYADEALEVFDKKFNTPKRIVNE